VIVISVARECIAVMLCGVQKYVAAGYLLFGHLLISLCVPSPYARPAGIASGFLRGWQGFLWHQF
jgi:hypothetical protein